MIPFLDIRAAYLELNPQPDEVVARVLDSGWYILGPEVEAFEADWAAYCDASHAVGLANGLDALTLALRALDIGHGDEVIVPSNTYIGAPLYTGKRTVISTIAGFLRSASELTHFSPFLMQDLQAE